MSRESETNEKNPMQQLTHHGTNKADDMRKLGDQSSKPGGKVYCTGSNGLNFNCNAVHTTSTRKKSSLMKKKSFYQPTKSVEEEGDGEDNPFSFLDNIRRQNGSNEQSTTSRGSYMANLSSVEFSANNSKKMSVNWWHAMPAPLAPSRLQPFGYGIAPALGPGTGSNQPLMLQPQPKRDAYIATSNAAYLNPQGRYINYQPAGMNLSYHSQLAPPKSDKSAASSHNPEGRKGIYHGTPGGMNLSYYSQLAPSTSDTSAASSHNHQGRKSIYHDPVMINSSAGYSSSTSTSTSTSSLLAQHSRQMSTSTIAANTDQAHGTQFCTNMSYPNRLFIQSDTTFLEEDYIFIRRNCIEIFKATQADVDAQGRGARPSRVGQLGLRCIFCKDIPKNEMAKQAIAFPTKCETIHESVRNFHRFHIGACDKVPPQAKGAMKLILAQQKQSQKYLRAYFALAAGELGIVDTPNGLAFGVSPNTSGTPSPMLQLLLDTAGGNEDLAAAFWQLYDASTNTGKKSSELQKFEAVASERTRRVLMNARKEPTPLVRPEDFAAVSDLDFLLYHQAIECRPTRANPKTDSNGKEHAMFAIRCKHCACDEGRKGFAYKGTYHLANAKALSESVFSKMLNHVMSCSSAPQEIKEAFNELKQLTSEHGSSLKRGSRKRYTKKIWQRLGTDKPST